MLSVSSKERYYIINTLCCKFWLRLRRVSRDLGLGLPFAETNALGILDKMKLQLTLV